MSMKIEEFGQYNIKGFTIESVIELAYRYGRLDARNQSGKDLMATSVEMVKDTLVGLDSFKEINN